VDECLEAAGVVSWVVGAVLYPSGAPQFIWLLLALIPFVGAFRMRQLRSHGLAMAGAIIASVPCTSYVFMHLHDADRNLALVVLAKPEVKSAFR